MAGVRMGEMIVSRDPNEELVALGLGSCIGLAIVDRTAGVAGLAHIVLPESNDRVNQIGKFADTAVPELIARMRRARAVERRFETALVGGAQMFEMSGGLDIGARNEAAVRAALSEARIRVKAARTGGNAGRTRLKIAGRRDASSPSARQVSRRTHAAEGQLATGSGRSGGGAMSELLTPDKIAALVDAAKQGQLPEATASQKPTRRGHRLRTVDFSRPTKFSADQQRRITRSTETFCQTANTRLSTELRYAGGVRGDQHRAADLGRRAAAAAAGIPVGAARRRPDRHADAADRRAAVRAGGPGVAAGRLPRRSVRRRESPPGSEIDWSLTRRLFEVRWCTELSLVWHELAGVTLSAGEIDPHDAGQVASVSEPTFTVLIECRIAKQSFAMALLIPWFAIEPIEAVISGRDPGHNTEVPTACSPMQKALADVPVTLRAEVASVDLEVSEILSLVPGSIIKFGVPADDGIMLFAENVKLARAQPGSHGPRRAVQICGPESQSR